MNSSNIFMGAAGSIFASSCILLILILMFLVSLRLYGRRKKNAYFSLSASLLLVIVQYGIGIALQLRDTTHTVGTPYFIRVLDVMSFLMINMGIYQLYNATRRRQRTIFFALLSGGIAIAGIRWAAVVRAGSPTAGFLRGHDVWIDLYLLGLTFLGFYLIAPHIGQRVKYRTALTFYVAVQAARIVNRYLLAGESRFISTIENFLPLVFYMIVFFILFERVVELLQAVYHSAIRDGLTGLYNRQTVTNRLQQLCKRHVKASVIFGDIDNFKKLNDTEGHQKGDEVLKHVAAIFAEVADGVGFAGRYGGEELVLVLTDPDEHPDDAAELIRRRVESEAEATISLGYSRYRKGMTSRELIAQADQAMYQAKRNGKNRVIGH